MIISAEIRALVGRSRILFTASAVSSQLKDFSITGTPLVCVTDDLRLIVEDVGGMMKSITSFFGEPQKNKIITAQLGPSSIIIGENILRLEINSEDYVCVSYDDCEPNLPLLLKSINFSKVAYYSQVYVPHTDEEGERFLFPAVGVGGIHTASLTIEKEALRLKFADQTDLKLDVHIHNLQILERDDETTYVGPWLRVNSRVKLGDEIFTHLWLPISRQHYDIASELVQDDRPSEDKGSYFDVELDAVMSLAHQNGQILEGSSVTIYLTDDRLSVASNEFEDLLVLTDRSITSAYFEEGYLFIMTDKSELCFDLQGLNVSMEQWLFNHPLIRRMTRDMKSSPDLIAKVLKDNEFIGV